ncbi:MAG: hypothetical protein V2J89_06430 [Halieaceae bacterium]|nr:hypothetical protein [Halieaceae bacterium]
MEPVLDINDGSLALWQDGAIRLSSPGYALLDNESYRFGEVARDQARLKPRSINHRYWSQLDLEPLTPAFGPGRHSADIVHAHLMDIYEQGGRPEQLIIAAPGNLQHDQLALLLGIAQSCPFKVTGLVDRAVAATATQPVAPYNWHVDVQLHQTLLTGMRLADGQLVHDTTVPIPGSGWLALQEAMARAIADAFIRQTRFDPRRAASTEQILFDALQDILGRLQTSVETNVDIEGRQARIERDALADALGSHYQRITRSLVGDNANIYLSPTLAQLPAINSVLPGAKQCAPTAIFEGIAHSREQVVAGDEGVHFVVSLPAAPDQQIDSGPAPAEASAPVQAAPAAEKIPPARCQIQFEADGIKLEPLSGSPVKVNGAVLEGPVSLRSGDLLEDAAGRRWRLTADDNSEDHGT